MENKLLILEDIRHDQKYSRDISDIQNYFYIREKIKQFSVKCNFRTFQKLFGEDGERLWNHFLNDCKNNIEKFETYLTQEQKNIFFVNGLLNESILF